MGRLLVTDEEIKMEGMAILLERLGIVEAERFISLVQREKFDYTEWQKGLWLGKTVREISEAAMEHRKAHPAHKLCGYRGLFPCDYSGHECPRRQVLS